MNVYTFFMTFSMVSCFVYYTMCEDLMQEKRDPFHR